MTDTRAKAEAILDSLVAKGLLGAALVGRDGLPLLLRFPRIQAETFSAMTAALLGAAEAALAELADSGPAAVHVDAGQVHLAVAGLDDVHILVVAAPAKAGPTAAASALAEGLRSLRTVLGA